jgi:LPXTG-motif cell wall-anchored protein
LTLDGQGDPSSVFIFQVGSALTTASASTMNLINGASACNVYWQVGSSATLGTGSHFKGTIMSLSSISATTGATVEGRALARKGQVSLDTNVFTTPVCAAPVVAPVVVAPSPVAVVPAPSASASASAPVVAPLNSAPVSAIPVVAAPVALSPDTTTPTNDAAPAGEVSGDTVQQQQLADTGATPNSRLFLAAGAALLAAGAGILLFKRFAPRFSRRH